MAPNSYRIVAPNSLRGFDMATVKSALSPKLINVGIAVGAYLMSSRSKKLMYGVGGYLLGSLVSVILSSKPVQKATAESTGLPSSELE